MDGWIDGNARKGKEGRHNLPMMVPALNMGFVVRFLSMIVGMLEKSGMDCFVLDSSSGGRRCHK